MSIFAARAGAADGARLQGLGAIPTPDPFSVLGWRQWFAATGGTRRVSEVEQRVGMPMRDPGNATDPNAINPAAKNLYFAGVFNFGADGSVTLVGGNGETAEQLATQYNRPDDAVYNPAADRPEGWHLLARGLSTVEPVFGTGADWNRVVRRAGGWQVVVTPKPPQPFNPKYVFRGTGMVDLATLSQAELNELPGRWTEEKGGGSDEGWQYAPTPIESQATTCANLLAPYNQRLAAFESVHAAYGDFDEIAPGISKIGARLAIMADANRDPGIAAAGCGIPFPEAVGYSPNPGDNRVPAPSTPIPGTTTPTLTTGGPLLVATPKPTPEWSPPPQVLIPIDNLTPVSVAIDEPSPVSPNDPPAPLAPSSSPSSAAWVALGAALLYFLRRKR